MLQTQQAGKLRDLHLVTEFFLKMISLRIRVQMKTHFLIVFKFWFSKQLAQFSLMSEN